jgi:hypothetical protein
MLFHHRRRGRREHPTDNCWDPTIHFKRPSIGSPVHPALPDAGKRVNTLEGFADGEMARKAK